MTNLIFVLALMFGGIAVASGAYLIWLYREPGHRPQSAGRPLDANWEH